MRVPLAETIYGRECVINIYGQMVAADSTPTIDVSKNGGTPATSGATIASVSTGIYRWTVPVTTGNGFAVGQWVDVVVNVTVGGLTSAKRVALFRVDAVNPDVNVATFTAGAITSTAIATDAITSTGLATSAVTEITTGIATSANQTTILSNQTSILGRLPAALVSGRMDSSVGAMASAVITATAIATDAITSTGLAASAASKIGTAVWATVLSGTRTAKGMLRRVHAVFAYGNSGMKGTTWTVTDEDGVTTLIQATQNTTAGTRNVASTLAGD